MYACPPDRKRAVSISSTNTSCSDKSSSSASATSFQGMLQCKWKDGLPYFVFSIDDHTQVYAASLSKVEPAGDYQYTFCSRIKGKKQLGDLCTMEVSTSIMSCPYSSSQVKETRFVLSLSREDYYYLDEVKNSNCYRKSSRRLVRKVAEVFKRRRALKSRGFKSSTWDPCENNYAHKLEAAAILIKDTFKNSSSKEDSIGGWGLEFLRKSGKNVCLKCSTSLNVLIPAGIHGRPKKGGGEPSSLVERWVSGGACDCGGWDSGCPLTLLIMGRPSDANSLEDCNSVDLFIQGSKQDVPTFRMTGIHDGLYYIHFQPTLSTLQSFAIAAAIIHTHSPLPRSKVYMM